MNLKLKSGSIGDDGFGTTEHALKSAHDALWAIANMQVKEETDKGKVLELCKSIARLELLLHGGMDTIASRPSRRA